MIGSGQSSISVERRDSNFFYRNSSTPFSSGINIAHQPSMITSTNISTQPDRPDILFCYANAFGTKNANGEFVPLSERQIIKPDVMFESIVKAVKMTKKKITIEKKYLNY